MNAIVLTAVLSALNSGLYASSRMLFALTRRGDAPQALAKVSRNGVPTRAILVATVFGYGAVVMSYVSPDKVFAFLVNSYGTVAIDLLHQGRRRSSRCQQADVEDSLDVAHAGFLEGGHIGQGDAACLRGHCQGLELAGLDVLLDRSAR